MPPIRHVILADTLLAYLVTIGIEIALILTALPVQVESGGIQCLLDPR